MIAFDTDVLTGILLGNTEFVERAAAIPAREQAVPVIVVEEIIRGRLNVIRQAEAGKASIRIERAYALEETFSDLQRLRILSYDSQAELLYQRWREERIRISTHDLRIAALCVTLGARLISGNRRDFEQVPGLAVEFWA